MTVSIIIAVKTWQKNLEECVVKCLELDYPDFEIIILPDAEIVLKDKFLKARVPIKVIATGSLKPGDKRDIGVKCAKGGIIAFIDDDAYPVKQWLREAVANLFDIKVGAVGGPAVTPLDDDIWQQASGKVFSSIMVSGKFVYRYLPKKRIEVDDLPSCNLIVRRSVIEEIGGFDTRYWPGEDTKLCLDIIKKLGKRIVYDPGILVYHHRRRIFGEHLRQIANYAFHRGFFVKKYPETSLRLSYFLPSIFVAGLLLGPLIAPLRGVYSISVILYLTLAALSGFIKNSFRLGILVFLGIILTHITYGVFFIKGLTARKLIY
jgi:GT2 family glycosyltransferase